VASAADARDDLLGVWEGTYDYGSNPTQGLTLVVFRSGSNYVAVFNFYAVGGRSTPSGSFYMNITNGQNGSFDLTATTWINRPSNYTTININGFLSGDVFSSTVSRNSFSLTRVHNNSFRYLGSHEHYGIETIHEATCTSAGESIFDCIICGEIIRETLPILPHSPGDWVVRGEATCTEPGYRVQYCRSCPDEIVLSEEIPINPNNHTPNGEWITLSDEPTCADEEMQLCEECDYPALTRASTIPHTPSGNWVIYEEPTCNIPGRRVQYCVISGSIARDDVIPMITGVDHVFSAERMSGNTFIPPIVTEYACEICGYDGGTSTSWALAWVSPSILVGFGFAGFMTVKISKRGSRKNISKAKEKVSMSKFVCPFCMKEYPKAEIAHSCSTCEKVAEPQTKCTESGCTGYVSVRRCPKCNEALPYIALETPNFPFSIVGVSGSGKTNYITVMLEELKNFDGLQLALNHQNNDAMEHQRDNYKRMYKELRVPDFTPMGDVKPQIWYLQNLSKKKKNLLGQEHIPAYSFTIFDGSGEDYLRNINNPNMDSPAALAVFRSKGILLVLDPLTLSNILDGEGGVDARTIRNSLGRGTDVVHSASDVINGIALYLKNMAGIKPSKKLNIPVAVILTKFDTVWDHPAFGPNALVKQKKLGITNGKVNWSEIDQVHEEIKHWLHAVGENGFVHTLEANFKDYKLFGVSSYGKSPASEYELSIAPEPHRVLDPILWLFKQKGAGFID